MQGFCGCTGKQGPSLQPKASFTIRNLWWALTPEFLLGSDCMGVNDSIIFGFMSELKSLPPLPFRNAVLSHMANL